MPVLFDLDDTLLDERATQEIYLAHLFDAYRAVLPHESQAQFGAAWRTAIDRHFARYLKGEISMAEQRRERIRDVFGDPEMAEAAADVIVAEFLATYENSWRLFPDVLETLDGFKGVTLGVVTNGSPEQQVKKLRSTGILDRFSVVVVSGSVGHAKPSRQIFDHACLELGCIAQDCAFVGDDWSRDVLGAAGAKMLPIWVNHGGPCSERDGVLAVSCLRELRERGDVRAAMTRALRAG